MQEAIKIYVKEVREISGKTTFDIESELYLMMAVFGRKNKKEKISLTHGKNKSELNIEDGQKFLSAGIIAGFRHPSCHLKQKDLMESI